MSRSVWKGPFVELSLMKKVQKHKDQNIKKPIKTWSRKSTIIPEFIGMTFEVHNGKKFFPVTITDESFEPVQRFLSSAATDPHVVAIKQTVYRTGADSVLMASLIEAARRGKEVTVVLELMARFDEETNMQWASRLEAVGAHVVYGVS